MVITGLDGVSSATRFVLPPAPLEATKGPLAYSGKFLGEKFRGEPPDGPPLHSPPARTHQLLPGARALRARARGTASDEAGAPPHKGAPYKVPAPRPGITTSCRGP